MNKELILRMGLVLFVVFAYFSGRHIESKKGERIIEEHDKQLAVVLQEKEAELATIKARDDKLVAQLDSLRSRALSIDSLIQSRQRNNEQIKTIILRTNPNQYDSVIARLYSSIDP